MLNTREFLQTYTRRHYNPDITDNRYYLCSVLTVCLKLAPDDKIEFYAESSAIVINVIDSVLEYLKINGNHLHNISKLSAKEELEKLANVELNMTQYNALFKFLRHLGKTYELYHKNRNKS